MISNLLCFVQRSAVFKGASSCQPNRCNFDNRTCSFLDLQLSYIRVKAAESRSSWRTCVHLRSSQSAVLERLVLYKPTDTEGYHGPVSHLRAFNLNLEWAGNIVPDHFLHGAQQLEFPIVVECVVRW